MSTAVCRCYPISRLPVQVKISFSLYGLVYDRYIRAIAFVMATVAVAKSWCKNNQIPHRIGGRPTSRRAIAQAAHTRGLSFQCLYLYNNFVELSFKFFQKTRHGIISGIS